MSSIDFSNRPICSSCNKNYRSVNYIRNDVRYYRSQCDECIRKKKKLPARKANWTTGSYKKKHTCDLCGFHSQFTSQIVVFHIDGNLSNIEGYNLRSICLNCVEVVKKKEIIWKRGDLKIDY